MMSEAGTDFITIRGDDFPVKTKLISQKALKFYPDNPRIFSLIGAGQKAPSQKDIEKQLRTMEHVKDLKADIKSNGGLIDPLIVKDGDMVVLEGNSRLAAYRLLVEDDPLKWDKIKCTVLPSDIPEPKIFALLGQYHVRGKKDWAPYEQAGFLYRRFQNHGVDVDTIAKDLGLKSAEARRLINTYQFMVDYKDTDRERWSYYFELLRSKHISSARKNYPEFDQKVVDMIKNGAFGKAATLRDKLPLVCKAKPKIVKRFLEGITTIDEAFEDAQHEGGDHATLQRINRFRKWLGRDETDEDIFSAKGQVLNKLKFELNQLNKTVSQLHKAVLAKKN